MSALSGLDAQVAYDKAERELAKLENKCQEMLSKLQAEQSILA